MPPVLDENEAQLLQEEEELMEELKLAQEKHKNVTLSYENIQENIKGLCKLDKREDNALNISNSGYLNLNESKIEPVSNQSYVNSPISEEELYKHYSDFLENTYKAFEENFLSKTEEEFIEIMKEKGYTAIQPTMKTGERGPIRKRSTLLLDKDLRSKEVDTYLYRDNEDSDIGIRDDDLKKEDDAFKLERDLMIKEFKEAV